MAIRPRQFQTAAIDAAVAGLNDKSRRFLIADEVGLGKTVVASGVVRRMSEGRRSPLTVFYVCSNSLLAHQNLGRLADFLPEEERKRAVSMVDRPSLMPTSQEPPDHPTIRLYSLSPGTAMARGGGRVEERAFAAALLRKVLDGKLAGLEPGLRLSANAETFKRHLRRFRDLLDDGKIGDGRLVERFRKSLRELLGLTENQQLPAKLNSRMDDFQKLASTLRAALAIAALDAINPDLVIFDEFQRFRDLVDPDREDVETGSATEATDKEGSKEIDAAARVLSAIRNRGSAILLLSATPYVPYRGRDQTGTSGTASDFHELIEFLGGKDGRDIRRAVEEGYATLNEELRKGVPDTAAVSECRGKLEALLRPLICRTERARAGHESAAVEVCRSDLTPQDVHGFRGFAEALRQEHPEWAVPLWSSVPLPMQSLGQRYTAWKAADWTRADGAIAFTERQRNGLAAFSKLPHPRLRALLEAMPREKLGLPWIAPSRPWWPLAGGWANREQRVDAKLLVFSRFRAAPASIAGLMSYSLEASAQEAREAATARWESFSRRRPLAANPERPPILALFHPSPLLTGLDPLLARSSNLDDIRASLMGQLSERLAKAKRRVAINDVGRESRARAPWHLIAALEERMGHWPQSLSIWKDVVRTVKDERQEPGAGSRLAAMVDKWDEARLEDVATITREEAELIVDLALEAPGVVLARALGRHWHEALTTERSFTTTLCWSALRAYFNRPLLNELLGEQQEERYPDALRRSVREGNLEATLDEHFWYLAQSDSRSWKERLEEFAGALRLRIGNASLHVSAEESFTLRCHAAMAMTEARAAKGEDDEDKPVRPDEVRRAFNTPFWPHVLVTTSVGQEGLDFHPWCRAIAHWDPPSGPVALEQREGRITRYAGLNVRRTLGKWAVGLIPSAGESPWVAIARKATRELSDHTGLRPWWTPDGTSNVQRFLMAASSSDVESTMSRLGRERALYRLVLGMPDQADLLALLMTRDAEKIDPRLICVDLAALRGTDL